MAEGPCSPHCQKWACARTLESSRGVFCLLAVQTCHGAEGRVRAPTASYPRRPILRTTFYVAPIILRRRLSTCRSSASSSSSVAPGSVAPRARPRLACCSASGRGADRRPWRGGRSFCGGGSGGAAPRGVALSEHDASSVAARGRGAGGCLGRGRAGPAASSASVICLVALLTAPCVASCCSRARRAAASVCASSLSSCCLSPRVPKTCESSWPGVPRRAHASLG